MAPSASSRLCPWVLLLGCQSRQGKQSRHPGLYFSPSEAESSWHGSLGAACSYTLTCTRYVTGRSRVVSVPLTTKIARLFCRKIKGRYSLCPHLVCPEPSLGRGEVLLSSAKHLMVLLQWEGLLTSPEWERGPQAVVPVSVCPSASDLVNYNF